MWGKARPRPPNTCGALSTIAEICLDASQPLRHRISMNAEIAAAQLEALGNPTRLGVYRLLVSAGVDGSPVGALQDKLSLAGSTLSHHLKKLIETGLVTQERQATTLICRAEYSAMNALIGYLSDECCADGACPPACVPAKAKRKSSVVAGARRG